MKISPNTDKSFSEVLSEWFQSNNRSFSCIKIGKIQSFNPSNQTATVQILHKKVNKYNLTARELVDYPLLCEVPVVVLGGGGSHISFPVSKGDDCLLLFNDYDYDNWYTSGEARPSNIDRVHNITDAFALVGVHSLVDLIQGYSSYVELKYSDSSKITLGDTLEVNNGTINLNGSVTANDLHSKTGATGTFTNVNGQTLTIVDGIITQIS